MSPVWVKLVDFGVSKRVLAQASTTFHTQVFTQVYSAPEVLGLDSNSETSDYTNSVDIWSLGCVIYELLVETKLFASEVQVSRYYFGKKPFPADKLKFLLPPTGTLLLKFMLLLRVQPGDRPTAGGALSHEWLVGLKSDSEGSGEDRDEGPQSRDESTQSKKGRDELATHSTLKERHSERYLSSQPKPGPHKVYPTRCSHRRGPGAAKEWRPYNPDSHNRYIYKDIIRYSLH